MTDDDTAVCEAIEENPAGAAPARRQRLTIVAAAVTICLLVASAGLWWKIIDDRSERSRTQDAVAAAETLIVPLLSYTHDSVEEQLTAALSNVSGSFANDYETLVNELIVPESRERQLDTNAVVVQSGVVDATESHVTVLLFVDQNTTTADSPGTRRDVSRIQVTLEDNNGRWWISNLQAV